MAKKTTEFPVVATLLDSDTLTGIQGNVLDINITVAALRSKLLAINDASNYYSSDNVDAALQQIGAWIAALPTQYQPLDADLTNIAALTTTAYGRDLLKVTDAAALRTALGAQPLDADLTNIAALTTTPYGRDFLIQVDAAATRAYIGAQPNDNDLVAIAALTTNDFGRQLLTKTDAASIRTYLGIPSAADPTFTGNVVVPTADAANEAVNLGQMQAADNTKVDKSTLTVDGDMYIRSGGAVSRITLDGLASLPAFSTKYAAVGTVGPQGPVGPAGPMGPAGPRRTIKNDYGGAYIPLVSDENSLITLNNMYPITLILPSDATANFVIGAEVDFLWNGLGRPTFVAEAGATVNGTPGLNLRERYSAASAKKVAANTWVVVGDLSI